MNGVTRMRTAAASAGTVLAALAMTAVAAAPAAADNPSGFSFNSAGEVGPGIHRESMVVGDFLFWRVFVQPGQKLSIKGSVDIPADFPHKQGPRFILNLYNPLREAIPLLDNPTNQLVPGTTHFEATSGAWTVGDGKKYENFDGTKGSFKEFKDDKYALRGSYYIQMSIAGAEGPQRGIVVPVKLEVSVEGTVVQRPDQPAGPEEEPRPTGGTGAGVPNPARTETPVGHDAPPAARAGGDDTSSVASDWGAPAGGALLALLLAAGLGYTLRRRFAVAAPGSPSPWSAHTSAAIPTHAPGPPAPPVAANSSASSGRHGFEPVPATAAPVPPAASPAPPPPIAPPTAPPVPPPVPERPEAPPPTGTTWRPGGVGQAPGTAPESHEVTQAFETLRPPEQPPGAAPRSD